MSFLSLAYSPVVVEHLREHSRVPIEEVLVQHGVVVAQCLGQPGQPRGRNLLQRRFVRLVPDPADVQHHPVFRVHVHKIHRATLKVSAAAAAAVGAGGVRRAFCSQMLSKSGWWWRSLPWERECLS